MSAEKNWQFELEEYIKQGEPGQIEKSEAWQTAIGLQAVDGLSVERCVKHLAKFASDIWQIHPFCEGNTRATAVFMIK